MRLHKREKGFTISFMLEGVLMQNKEIDIFNMEKANTLAAAGQPEITEETDLVKLTQAQAKILSEATVDLIVEIGSIVMSIEDLIDLMPGELFEFQVERGKVISLKLGAKTIAEAKFIKKEGNYALEIISVFD